MKFIVKLGLIALSITSLTYASTEDIVSKQKEIESKLDSVTVKEGIEFGGEFRSEFIRSEINGDGANDTLAQREDITYTQVDFDIKARPNTSTTARVIMRMHASWPIFFGSLNNPITTRWISLDGKVGDYTWYHVGDLKTKWSEYSIWSDNTNQIFEPYIFEEQRKQQMGEAFLGDNYRPVQGVNLKSAFKVGKVDYLGIDLLGARLRTAFMPKLVGGEPIGTSSNLVASSFESAEMDKFLVGGKFDVESYNVGIFASYNATLESELTSKYSVTAPMNTGNLSVGANIAIDKMIGMKELILEPKGEFAMSSYSIDTSSGMAAHNNFVGDQDGSNDGTAMTVGALLGYEVEKSFNVKVDFGYVNNEETYRNDMSQSQEFQPRQIMNTDNNRFVNEHYTYFDARYRGAYKSVTKIPLADGTMEYKPYPTNKLAYTNMIITAEESDLFRAQTSLNAPLQPFTPFAFGPSTPNLNGIKLNGDIGVLDNKIELKGYFSSINEIKGFENNLSISDSDGVVVDTMSFVWDKAAFGNFGGGINLHVGKLASINRVINLSFGYEGATASRAAVKSTEGVDGMHPVVNGEMNLTSALINIGLYANIIPRLSILGGYQIFTNKDDTKIGEEQLMDRKDTQLLAGLEYKVSEGAYLLVEGGFVAHENTLNTEENFQQSPLIITKIKVNF